MPHKLPTDKVQREVYLPVRYIAIVDTLLFDPMKGGPRKGSFSNYVTALIHDDLIKKGLLSGKKDLDSDQTPG